MSRKASTSKAGPSSRSFPKSEAGPSRESGRRKSARRIVSSDEDSDEQDTTQDRRLPTSANATQNITRKDNVSDNATLTNNMVKYFLNFSATKIPIKKGDISKSVNVHPKLFPETFKSCTKILKEVYGLEVTEVAEGKSAKVYIVYSNLSNVSALQLSPDQAHETTLLFIVLSYIFMKGGEIQEAHLFHFLNQLNIDTNEPHKIFGDVAKLVREKFPRQLYLKRSKFEIEGMNDMQIHLSWGPRAMMEFDKKDVLKAVSGVMNKSPATFINQYHAATQEEEEGEETVEIL